MIRLPASWADEHVPLRRARNRVFLAFAVRGIGLLIWWAVYAAIIVAGTWTLVRAAIRYLA